MKRAPVTDPRVRRYTLHTKPDHLGRVQFTLEWVDPSGRFEPQPRPCGCGHEWKRHIKTANGAWACRHFGCGCRDVVPEPVGYNHGQVFFTDPKPYVVRDRADGLIVEIIDETAPSA